MEATLKLTVCGSLTTPMALHLRTEQAVLDLKSNIRRPTTIHRTWERHSVQTREISTILQDNTIDFYDGMKRPSMPAWIIALTHQLQDFFRWCVENAIVMDYTLCRYPRPVFLDIPIELSLFLPNCGVLPPEDDVHCPFVGELNIKRVLIENGEEKEVTATNTMEDPANKELFEKILHWFLYEAYRGLDRVLVKSNIIH
jgi:hypothetical protein